MTVTERIDDFAAADPPDPHRTGSPRVGSALAVDRARRRLVPRRAVRAAPVVWIYVLVLALTVFQRFVVPGTIVSIALPVAFLVVTMLAVQGHAVADPGRAALYGVALALCALAGFAATAWEGVQLSITSLGLLAVTYLPCCARASPALRNRLPDVLRFFQQIMTAAAAVCVGQWTAQMAGWQFTDLLSWVPANFLVPRLAFNLSYPLYYGSTILKSNGIVFLEPSVCSQFLALAIIIQVMLGTNRWRLVLFLPALLTTLSGTGIVLLGAGLAILAYRRGGVWATRAGITVVIAVLAVSLTPAGDLLADRSSETTAQGSSGNSRFVAPYQQVASALSNDLPALAVGRGAGSVDRDQAYFNPQHVPVNYPAVPKLVAEYGLPAALAFIAFLLSFIVRRVPSPTLGVMAVLMFFVLSGALLQPMLVYTVWLFSGLFSAPAPAPRRELRQRQRPAETT
jgi:hypothetical protein